MMITCLNSISKKITWGFIYVASAKSLWDELGQRFGESNGSVIYQFKCELITSIQGNQCVVIYYNKHNKLWDERSPILPIPTGSNSNNQLLFGFENTERLMQFLVGLKDSFDGFQIQIPVLDPLPSVNKTYSMVQRVEKQRQIQLAYPYESNVILVQSTPTDNISLGRYYTGASNRFAHFKQTL